MTLPSPRLPWNAPVEQAVRWLISTPGVSYDEAARRYQVTINNLRSRVEYRYGSLKVARQIGVEEDRKALTLRRCIVCKRQEEMTEFQRICKSCSRSVDKKNGGMD